MARAGSAWSVKGIDEETRAIARSRAGESDLTIGAWVDQAILAYSSADAPSSPIHGARRTRGVPTEAAKIASPTLGDQEILTLIDQELEASRSRLDGALRPVGYALKDLALRLVAAEALERGGTPRLGGSATAPDREPKSLARPPSETLGSPLPPPPLGSLAPEITDAEVPTPRSLGPSGSPAPDVPQSAPTRPFPSGPTHNLHATISGMEAPPLHRPEDPAESEQELGGPNLVDEVYNPPATSRPEPHAPTTSLFEVDPSDMPEPPQLERRMSASVEPDPLDGLRPSIPSPSTLLAEARIQPPDPGVRFTGIQGGFESNPDLAYSEARRASRRRMRRLAAAIFPFVILGSLVVGYIFAEPLGLMPLRTQLAEKMSSHVEQAGRTLSDAFSEGRETLAGLTASQNQVEHAGPSAAIDDVKEADRTRSRDEQARPIAKAAAVEAGDQDPPRADAKESGRARVPNPLKPDDPAVANLVTPASQEKPAAKSAAGGALSSPSGSVRKPEKLQSLEPPRLAQLPPPPPIIAGRVDEPGAKKPKQATRLAALPAPPRISGTTIPPSGTNPGISIDALMSAARAGDPRSQHELARRYIQGDGVDQDFAEGSEWFREAAIQGVASAQYNLAVLYERGLGVTKDDVRALLWYHSAAEQSHPLAQYNLGIFYLQGRGIPLSYGEAVRWFRAASSQGISKATYNLAVLTEDGLGVPPDKDKALALYQQAADAGHHEAAIRLALLRNPNGAKTKPATFAETANTQTDDVSTASTVADIQAILRGAGIYDGKIDGIAGPKTRTAIREYQRRRDLPITGIPSENLLDFMKSTSGS